jgi:hypothetical protein
MNIKPFTGEPYRKPTSPSFYDQIDLNFLDDFDVKSFEREMEVEDMQIDFYADAYIRRLEADLRHLG